jgi:hypothetical protein
MRKSGHEFSLAIAVALANLSHVFNRQSGHEHHFQAEAVFVVFSAQHQPLFSPGDAGEMEIGVSL